MVKGGVGGESLPRPDLPAGEARTAPEARRSLVLWRWRGGRAPNLPSTPTMSRAPVQAREAPDLGEAGGALCPVLHWFLGEGSGCWTL